MELELPKVDIATILNWASKQRTLVTAGAIFLAVFVFYFGFYRPKAAAVAGMRQRYEAAGGKIQTGSSQVESLARTRKRVTELEQRLRDSVERMSGDIQLVHVLKQLAAQASAQNILVERIKVGDVKQKVGRKGREEKGKRKKRKGKKGKEKPKVTLEVRTQEVEMNLYCSYSSAARYLESLKDLPALVVVHAIEIERDPATFPNLKVLLTLRFHSVKRPPKELLKS